MAPVRTLTDDEITRLVWLWGGIPPKRFAEITKPFLVADNDALDGLRTVQWGYEDRVRFILEAAQTSLIPS